METNKKYLYGAVALALLAIVVVGSLLLGDAADRPSDVTRTPAADSTAYAEDPDVFQPSDSDPSGTENGEGSAGPETSPKGLKVPRAAKELAATAIKTYTQYSYTDPSPRSWVDRLERISTGVYVHSLDDTFGSDASDDNYWAQEVVPAKRETRTEVVRVSLEDGRFDNTRSKMTFVVTYLTSVRSVDYPQWSEPEEEMSQFVSLVKRGGRWLVDDIVPARMPS